MSTKRSHQQVCLSLSVLTGFFALVSFGNEAQALPFFSKNFYQGEEIDLQAACTPVKIEVDPSLTKGINQRGTLPKNITITVAKDEAQRRILIRAKECVPSARLTLQIPANFSIVYHDSPKASLSVKGAIGSFEGTVSEGDEVSLGQVDSLDLKMTGNSKLSVEKLQRAAQLIAGDKASFTAKNADLSVFSVFGSAQSDVFVKSGHIATAHFTMSEDAQAQIFAAVGHADARTKDRGFIRFGTVSQAPETTDGSIIRKEDAPVGSIVISQPDVVVPPPPESILGFAPEAVETKAETIDSEPEASSKKSKAQPSLTESEKSSGTKDSEEDEIIPAPGVPPTALQPVTATPIAPLGQKAETFSAEQNLKEEIKKEKAEQKAAKKDEKRMNDLATASVTAPSSMMVS